MAASKQGLIRFLTLHLFCLETKNTAMERWTVFVEKTVDLLQLTLDFFHCSQHGIQSHGCVGTRPLFLFHMLEQSQLEMEGEKMVDATRFVLELQS